MELINRAKVGEIFQDNTCMHLLIWNRFCEKSHADGLRLMKELVQEYDLVMPMLRPLGRRPQYYSDDCQPEYKNPPPNELCDVIPSAPLLPGDYTGHCELWVQVADSISNDLLEFIKPFFNEQYSNFAIFLDHENPIWAPLGESLQKCQYATGRDGLSTKILCDIGEEQSPAFLKLIWYRSTILIADWLSVQNGNTPVLDPAEQKDVLHEMMAKIFSDFDPKEYGLSCSFNLIDPSSFAVSHMSAFAVNALMPTIHFHQMEQYFGNRGITHPYSYPNRDKYLKEFCS